MIIIIKDPVVVHIDQHFTFIQTHDTQKTLIIYDGQSYTVYVNDNFMIISKEKTYGVFGMRKGHLQKKNTYTNRPIGFEVNREVGGGDKKRI